MNPFLQAVATNRVSQRLPLGLRLKRLDEVYDRLIHPFLPDPVVVGRWHEVIKRYAEQPGSTLFVRLYRDGKKENKYLRNRGGFLTRTRSGPSYVFTDNSLPQAFFALALNSFAPSYQDREEAIRSFGLPVTFRSTKAEDELRAYRADPKLNPGLNDAGFKLCHVEAMGKGNGGIRWRDLFPRGERHEWNRHGERYVRELTDELPGDAQTLMREHFIRLIHPANHFLGPGKRWHRADCAPDIGEYAPLLTLVRERLHDRYCDEVDWLSSCGKAPIAQSVDVETHEKVRRDFHSPTIRADHAQRPIVATPQAVPTTAQDATPTPRCTALHGFSVILSKRTQIRFDIEVERLLLRHSEIRGYVLVIAPTTADGPYEPGVYVFSRKTAIDEIADIRRRSALFEKNGWNQSRPPTKLRHWFHPLSVLDSPDRLAVLFDAQAERPISP